LLVVFVVGEICIFGPRVKTRKIIILGNIYLCCVFVSIASDIYCFIVKVGWIESQSNHDIWTFALLSKKSHPH